MYGTSQISLDRFEFMHEILVLMASSTTKMFWRICAYAQTRQKLLVARIHKGSDKTFNRRLGLLDTSEWAFIEILRIKALVLVQPIRTWVIQ